MIGFAKLRLAQLANVRRQTTERQRWDERSGERKIEFSHKRVIDWIFEYWPKEREEKEYSSFCTTLTGDESKNKRTDVKAAGGELEKYETVDILRRGKLGFFVTNFTQNIFGAKIRIWPVQT